MFDGIKDVVIKTLLAVEPKMREEWATALADPSAGWLARGPEGAHASSSCFEIYGFDILVDKDLKSWVLEVNLTPSLSSGSPLDKRIKTKLIADALTLKGICPAAPPPSAGSRRCRGVKRSLAGGSSSAATAAGVAVAKAESPSPWAGAEKTALLAENAAILAACADPADAERLFDRAAWDLVLEAHDQDMRCGSLSRIYPTVQSSRYVPYMEAESFPNVVLRRWYEAGGAERFWAPLGDKDARCILPAWVPRPACLASKSH